MIQINDPDFILTLKQESVSNQILFLKKAVTILDSFKSCGQLIDYFISISVENVNEFIELLFDFSSGCDIKGKVSSMTAQLHQISEEGKESLLMM